MNESNGPENTRNRILVGGALLAAGILLALTALPGGRRRPTPPPDVASGSSPSSYPASSNTLSQSSITSNNLATGTSFRLGLHSRPGVIGTVLASSDGMPSVVAGLSLEVSSDWFFLLPPTWNGGGSNFEIVLPVPASPTLDGLRLTMQGVVMDPLTGEVGITGHVDHEVITHPSNGRRVLLLRQTVNNAQVPWSMAAADGLMAMLSSYGHTMVVADDALPVQLETYDCILDCRFTTVPPPAEKAAMVRYLQGHGGLFMLCGPYYGSTPGQLRAAWIQDLLVTKLGLPLTVFSGGNLSGLSGQQVSSAADARYLTQPVDITGIAYEVENEGGNFGPVGWQPVGTPWIVDTSAAQVAYGMLFRHSDVTALPVRGSLAVLFTGSADALAPSPLNPLPDLVFNNLVWFLDT